MHEGAQRDVGKVDRRKQNLNGGKAPRKMVQDAKVTLGKTHSNNQEMQAMIFSSFNTRGCGQQASRAGVGF